MKLTKFLGSSILLALALTLSRRLEAAPASYRIEGTFRVIRHMVGGQTTTVTDELAEILFTVTDPTEILEGPTFTAIGAFRISSASVTIPVLGLSEVPLTDTNLDLFLADTGSLEQFAFRKTVVSSPALWVSADLLLSESGSDFIEDPNQPLPLKFDVPGRQLEGSGFSGDFALNLTDGSKLELTPPASNSTIANAPPPPSGFSCGLDISLDGGTLMLDFEIGSRERAVWNFWVSRQKTALIWSVKIPVLDPSVSVPVQVPNFPKLGSVGFLTTLVTSKGIVCSEWKVFDTGLPEGALRNDPDLRRLFTNR